MLKVLSEVQIHLFSVCWLYSVLLVFISWNGCLIFRAENSPFAPQYSYYRFFFPFFFIDMVWAQILCSSPETSPFFFPAWQTPYMAKYFMFLFVICQMFLSFLGFYCFIYLFFKPWNLLLIGCQMLHILLVLLWPFMCHFKMY